MAQPPFRFVHASDFHLERPLYGVAEAPSHLRELFVDAPYRAAQRVFDLVVSEQVEFLVLSGDILHCDGTGPRGPAFLLEQFGRLKDHGIPVYWAGGHVDPPGLWPDTLDLPDNVRVFARERPDELFHLRDGAPLARLVGASGGPRCRVRATDFLPGAGGLFSIAVAYGLIDERAWPEQGIDYWALGGIHRCGTSQSGTYLAHYPGTPQGRQPEETGAHGATLVQVDIDGRAKTKLLACDCVRWHREHLEVDATTSRTDLDRQFAERIAALQATAPGIDLLCSWTIDGSGPLVHQLRHGHLATELLASLRNQYGAGRPALWSISLAAEPLSPPSEFFTQDTILGDLLREVRRLEDTLEEPLDVDQYLHERHLAGSIATAVRILDPPTRERTLREVAALSAELLGGDSWGGEEPLA